MTDEHWPHRPGADDVVVDSRTLKAMAHPLRTKVLSILREQGPATATTLARRLGVNTGATSYHLRQLESAGLVTEDADRGNARDRWWKAVHRSSYFNDLTLLRDEPELAGAYLHAVAQRYSERVSSAIDQLPTLPTAWQETVDLSDFSFQLTAAQFKQMREDIYEVFARYHTEPDAPAPRGSRPVAVQLQLFPRSDAG